jgi:predicted membrane channel-forming protein YqfA (hemolysin III family)
MANHQNEKSKRRRAGMSWICGYLICSTYALSTVPGYTYLLIIPVVVSIFVFVLLKKAPSKRALAASVAFSLLCGFSIRRLIYEPYGVTSTLLGVTFFIGFVALAVGYYVYFQEAEKPAE